MRSTSSLCAASPGETGLACAGLFVSILFAPQVLAQASPTLRDAIPFGRLVIDSQIGSERDLGFRSPDLGVGFSVEKPLGSSVELQTFAEYSPDKKHITNNGNNFQWGAKGIWFPRWRFGVSGEARRSYLWTSQFNKSGWVFAPGLMIRDSFGTRSGRFSVDYVIPRGCVWAVECRLSPGWHSIKPHTRTGSLLRNFAHYHWGRNTRCAWVANLRSTTSAIRQIR